MITVLTTRELYGIFLESEFWRDLALRKRGEVGECERCGRKENLEAHHRFYRESWFDTELDDLEVLCRECHQSEHGLNGDGRREQEAGIAFTRKQLETARSMRIIDRKRFISERDRLKALGLWSRPNKVKVYRIKRRRKMSAPCKPWHYNPTIRKKWVSRGTSSN